MTYQPQPAASLLRLGREGDFSVPWPEKGGRRRAEDGDFFRSVAGLRASRGQTGGRFSFTGRKSEGTESELIKSSVELPGTPVWLLSALSPVRSGNMSRLLPAAFRLFPHILCKVHFPSQADWTGGRRPLRSYLAPFSYGCPLAFGAEDLPTNRIRITIVIKYGSMARICDGTAKFPPPRVTVSA